MIWGKTFKEKREETNRKYSKFPFVKRYAFLPTITQDGRWIWLEIYYKRMLKHPYGHLWRMDDITCYSAEYVKNIYGKLP